VAHRYQFGDPLKNTFSGGMATVVPALRRLGFEVVGSKIDERTVKAPEEVPDDLWEGARKQVSVNAYERNVKARAKCIEVHGSSCAICGFNFGNTYGDDFSGFIHVHHKVPLAEIGERYKVDPARDLVPLFANCHSILHHGGVHRSIEEVKALIESAPNPSIKRDALKRAPYV